MINICLDEDVVIRHILDNFGYVDDMSDFVSKLADKFVERFGIETTHKQIGIDERSYGKLWVTTEEDWIITQNVSEYYSGFSYVPNDEKFRLGNYMFYSDKNSRIKDHIQDYLDYEGDDVELEKIEVNDD